MTVTNIFNQDPAAPATPALAVPVTPAPAQTPAPVIVNQPAAPSPLPPPRPQLGCPVMGIVMALGLIVFVIITINLILGALGISVFGREWFDKNVMLPFGSWVLSFVVGGSKTRLGYWVVASIFGPVFTIVMTWIIARHK